MIELRQLRYLLAAAEAGSFCRAARQINIKQATLSRHILHIESRLGIALFDRTSSGAVLTTNGRNYVEVARRIVSEFAELNEWVRGVGHGTAGRLTVGFYTSLSAGNLGATLAEFSERHIDVQVRLVERDRRRLFAGLESGLVDIAIVLGEAKIESFVRRPVWSERLLVALREGHALEARDRIYWPDLADEHFLMKEADPGPELVQILLGKLAAPALVPHIEVNDVRRDTLLSMVAHGRYISIVTASAAGIPIPGVAFREIYDAVGQARIGFSGYWRAANDNPALRRFIEFVGRRYALPDL